MFHTPLSHLTYCADNNYVCPFPTIHSQPSQASVCERVLMCARKGTSVVWCIVQLCAVLSAGVDKNVRKQRFLISVKI